MFRLQLDKNFGFTDSGNWSTWGQRRTRSEKLRTLVKNRQKPNPSWNINRLFPNRCQTNIQVTVLKEKGRWKKFRRDFKQIWCIFNAEKKKVIYERAKFYLRAQKDKETIEKFIRGLYESPDRKLWYPKKKLTRWEIA